MHVRRSAEKGAPAARACLVATHLCNAWRKLCKAGPRCSRWALWLVAPRSCLLTWSRPREGGKGRSQRWVLDATLISCWGHVPCLGAEFGSFRKAEHCCSRSQSTPHDGTSVADIVGRTSATGATNFSIDCALAPRLETSFSSSSSLQAATEVNLTNLPERRHFCLAHRTDLIVHLS